jgi:hypothetical protein
LEGQSRLEAEGHRGVAWSGEVRRVLKSSEDGI